MSEVCWSMKYDLIWLRSVDRWGRAGTYGPRDTVGSVSPSGSQSLHVRVDSFCFFFLFSKPRCNLTVGQVAACLQSIPICNYLHSHSRRLMRPCCFLMEQRQGPEQDGRHSLSCDQAARCVDTQNQMCGPRDGCSQTDSHPTATATLQCLVSEGESPGQGQWRKKGWDGWGCVGKSDGFCFVFLWWLCSLNL